jgi:aspartate racemase
MAKLGMIGGTGPESTVDYYKRLIALYREKTGDDSYPEIIISSINMTQMLAFIAEKHWDALIEMISREVECLSKADASIGFLSANTPHIVFEQVQAKSPIPLVSIVEATRAYAEGLGLKKVGLMGTLFTMQSDFYQREFQKAAIEIAVPLPTEQQYIQQKLMTEIELGVFLESTRSGLLKIAQRMIAENSIQGLILGCTELPLILTKDQFGIPFLNTTQIHVESILETYMGAN